MHNDIAKILIGEDELDKIVTRIAERIDTDYKADGLLVLVAVLKGSVVFMGDLMKKIRSPLEIDFMKVSSYTGTESSGKINVQLDLRRPDIKDCDIVIVEDIIDSGRTLSHLVEYLKEKGARSVRTCTLLDKPSRRVVDLQPDYVGCEIADEFVVGYGLDYNEKYRALPYVGVLHAEVYSDPDTTKQKGENENT